MTSAHPHLTPAAAVTLVGQPLHDDDVVAVATALTDGGWSDEEGGAVLHAWTMRGESASELAALVQWLRQHALTLPWQGGCLDLCGTGGSGLSRFNISTTVAFIAAAAGVPVVKHGNKGSKIPNGSFDLLESLGVPFQLPCAALHQLFSETGVCFLFARQMHPLVGKAAPARAAAAARGAKRTIFNLAGPLANPARPQRQVIGVPDTATAHVIAEALVQLKVERAAVVRGHPGIDEISITGPTHVWDIRAGHIHHTIMDRTHQSGLEHAHLPGGSAVENAATFSALINNLERGPLRDMVVANAACALDVWHDRPVEANSDHRELALALLESGAVRAVFERHRQLARGFSA